MSSSIQMIVECHRRGYITKEAAERLLATRERMIKQAMRKQALSIFRAMGKFKGKAKPKRFRDILKRPPQKKPEDWKEVAGNLAKIMGVAGGTAGVTHGLYAAGGALQAKKLQEQIADSYTQMMDEYPRLKEEEPEKVRRPFGLLARVAPNLAAEPMVAGAFVYNNIQQGGVINHGDIKAIAEAQNEVKKSREAGKPPYFASAQTASTIAQKAMGMADVKRQDTDL